MKAFTEELQETLRCMSDSRPIDGTTLRTRPTRAVSPHGGCHPKTEICFFPAPSVFLNFVTHDASPPREFQCKEAEWRDGAGWAVPDGAGCCQPSVCPPHVSSSPLPATFQVF